MYDNSEDMKKPHAGPWRFDSSRQGLFETFGKGTCKARSICYRRGCETVVRYGARLLHTILPEKFEMWKLENAVLGMFHKVLQCHGRTFGIDLRSPRPLSGSAGGGGGGGRGRCGGVRMSPSLLPPGKLGIYGFRNAVCRMFHKVFLQKSQSHSSRDYFANQTIFSLILA